MPTPSQAASRILSFSVAREIEGLDEGVSTMKVGGSRRLIVPPKLAYGDEGKELTFGDKTVTVPPDATLIFEVDLLGVR